MINNDPQQIEIVTFTFKGEGGDIISAAKWLPQPESTQAILIINHGMAEHIQRYHDFAIFLADKGIAVYGEDHRGHGQTAGSEDKTGHFADDNGWFKVLGDIRSLHLQIMEEHKGLPIFMMGHSMGSFLTRQYLSLYGSELAGAILSGTGNHGFPILMFAKLLASSESFFKGKRHRSRLLDSLVLGSNNNKFKFKGATGFEWLSRDVESVRKYIEDPYCGFICTCGFYIDFFKGLMIIRKKHCYISAPNSLPILIISGKNDPVGSMGKGVEAVAAAYIKNGKSNLIIKLKNDMRHECLNEIGRDECFRDIYEWLTTRLTD